jgi:hypothetical protein
MAAISETYQTKVGFEQGAEKLFVKADGYFKLYDEDVTGQQLKTAIFPQTQITVIVNSAGVLSTVNVPSEHGLVIYSVTDSATAALAQMTSCKKGQQLVLMGRGGGSTASIVISTLTGVTMIGILSGNLSTIDFQYSSNSQPYVKLVASADNEWSVVETSGQVTLQASA